MPMPATTDRRSAEERNLIRRHTGISDDTITRAEQLLDEVRNGAVGRPMEDLESLCEVLVEGARRALLTAERERRGLNDEERRAWDSVASLAEEITTVVRGRRALTGGERRVLIGAGANAAGEDRWADQDGREVRPLGPRDSMAAAVRAQDGGATHYGQPLSIGRYVRGLITGDWRDAEAERRALSEGTLSEGGYMVPRPLAAQVIDAARNQARVVQAGALTIPMDAQTLRIARVDSDPAVQWKEENALGDESDITFGAVEFRARTLMTLVKASVELVEDARNFDTAVSNALGEALGLELDRAALRGSGSAEEPRGIRNTPGIQTIDLGTHGATVGYSDFSRAFHKVLEANAMEPFSAIYAPRTAGELDRLVDSTSQPLRPPESWGRMGKFTTNQVPVDLTKGTAEDASEAYVGKFAALLIGMRTYLQLEVSRTAGDAFKRAQVWIRAYLRADVQLARPAHFCLIDGIIPPE